MPPQTRRDEELQKIDELNPKLGQNVRNIVGSVSAGDIANPPTIPTLTEPQQPTIPQGTMNTVRSVARNAQGLIEADTEEQRRLKALREEQAAFGGDTISDLFNQQLDERGVNTNLTELKDINLQLADMDTASALTQTRIAGAEGQTLNQGQREITQEQREEAVRQTGLAARAAVLTDNINTATQLARDAANFAYQDQTLELTNRQNQINDLRQTADAQTQQLLDVETREIEAEQARIQEVKDAISAAILAGASANEVSQLTGNQLSDEDKLALAQSVQAREARTDIGLSREATRASTAASYASRRLNLIDAAQEGDPQAINQLGYDPRAAVSGTTEYSDVIDGAANLVGAERGKTSKVAMQNAIKAGDYPTAYQFVANNVEEALTGENKTKFANARTDYTILSNLRDTIAEYEEAGGDMSFLKGTTEQIARRFGQLQSDPRFTELAVQLEREFQSYRQNMTGAAFGPKESREYAAVNPRTSASIELNLATIDGARNALENRIRSTVETRVPNADKLWSQATGEGVDPETAQLGDIIEYGGVQYRKVGEDQYEEI